MDSGNEDAGLSVGDKVSAKMKGSRAYYTGKVHAKNENGTYDIKFDDGDRDRAVTMENIKPSSPKKKSTQASESEFLYGDKVTAKCKGSRYITGKIQANNGDRTYDIYFDDGDRLRDQVSGGFIFW